MRRYQGVARHYYTASRRGGKEGTAAASNGARKRAAPDRDLLPEQPPSALPCSRPSAGPPRPAPPPCPTRARQAKVNSHASSGLLQLAPRCRPLWPRRVSQRVMCNSRGTRRRTRPPRTARPRRVNYLRPCTPHPGVGLPILAPAPDLHSVFCQHSRSSRLIARRAGGSAPSNPHRWDTPGSVAAARSVPRGRSRAR